MKKCALRCVPLSNAIPRHAARTLVALFFATVFAFAGCSSDTSTGETGSLHVNLEVGSDEIDQVHYMITGNGMDPMSDWIDTSAPETTASVEVFGLLPGDYTVTLSATTRDGETMCEGSEDFSIELNKLTEVTVYMGCKLPDVLGGVRVNGELNVCAVLTQSVVKALQTSLGYDFDLSAMGDDAEGDPIEYLWTGTGGSVDDPTAMHTTYTCERAGNHTVTIAVSDDGFDYCTDSWTTEVTCVGGDGPECETDEACEELQICDGGQCVDVDCKENADCDVDEICEENSCKPDVECTETAIILTQNTPGQTMWLLTLEGQQGTAHTQVFEDHAVFAVDVFDATSLLGANVVYINNFIGHSDDEVEALVTFVEDGGRLVIAGDHTPSGVALDVLAARFDVGYGPDLLQGRQTAQVTDFNNDVTNGPAGVVDSFLAGVPNSGLTSTNPDFRVAALYPDDGVALGLLSLGFGEVVFLTDLNPFDDYRLGLLDNQILWTNLFDYLDGDCDAGEVCTDGTCEPDVECSMDGECADGKQCTKDLCTAGECLNPNEDLDTACDQDGGAFCDGNGNCVECNDDTQCPDDNNQCTMAACDANQCGQPSVMNGLVCDYMGGMDNGVCEDGTCVEAPECSGFEDNFDDGVLDPLWFPFGVDLGVGSCPEPVETGGQLVMAKPSGCVGGGSAFLQRLVVGDFEVTVDFELLSFSVPSVGARYATLQVLELLNSTPAPTFEDLSFVATIERYNTGNTETDPCPPSAGNYKAYTTTSMNCDPSVAWTPTSDLQGRFQITRQGELLRMSYWDGSQWQELQSGIVTSEDLVVHMYAHTSNDDDGAIDVRFDNFVLTCK